MEQETLFTASKWDILKILSSGNKSPLQLAKLSNTSVANISQQLRLLEMAGLVQCTRISNRDKGQPRLLYSLVGNQSFLISSSKDFVDKKLLNMTEYNKVILKIWFLDKPELHYFLEKAFWGIEDNLSNIDSLLVDTSFKSADVSLVVVSENHIIKRDLKKMTIKNKEGVSKNFVFNVKSKNEFKKASNLANLYVLYDPSNFVASINSANESKENSLKNKTK